MKIQDVITLFRNSNGYVSSSELIQHRVHTATIRSMLEQGLIEKIKAGLYRLPPDELPQDNTFTHEYFDVATAIPDGVFCLTTALFYHGLSTRKPDIFDIAIPPTRRNKKIYTVPVRFYRFHQLYYSLEVEDIPTQIVPIPMYSKEKSVCDAIRMRHIIGEDVAMEGLNIYIRQRQKDINKLFEIAGICKIKHIIEPAVKAMIGF